MTDGYIVFYEKPLKKEPRVSVNSANSPYRPESRVDHPLKTRLKSKWAIPDSLGSTSCMLCNVQMVDLSINDITKSEML